VAGARAGCPEAPVTCEVAKGEWRMCEEHPRKQNKGAGSPQVSRTSPQLVDQMSVVLIWFVCFFFWGGVTCCGDATGGQRVPTENNNCSSDSMAFCPHFVQKQLHGVLFFFFFWQQNSRKNNGAGAGPSGRLATAL